MAQVPYEFLVRWDHDTGALKGASIKMFDNITQREGMPQPVAIAGAVGFPLADVLTAIQSGAIITADAATADLATEKAAHAVTQTALDAANTALANAQAKLTAAGIP